MTQPLDYQKAALFATVLERPDAYGPYADWLRENGPLLPEHVMPLVLLYPESDGLRLLYAVACDEVGDTARAEFIRVQVELAKMPPKPERFNAFEVDCTDNQIEFLPGGNTLQEWQRVSLTVKSRAFYAKKCKNVFHNVLIVQPGNRPREVKAIAVIDEHSVPWPGDHLRRRERELWLRVSVQIREEVGDKIYTLISKGGVRRGFIEEVHVPTLATWWSECPYCTPGSTDRVVHREDCSRCHGTGTTGIGRKVVRACPVRVVKCGDKSALSAPDQPARWVKQGDLGHETETPFRLPAEVFDLLPTGDGADCVLIRDAGENWNSSFSVRDYHTAAAANDALSAALIKLFK